MRDSRLAIDVGQSDAPDAVLPPRELGAAAIPAVEVTDQGRVGRGGKPLAVGGGGGCGGLGHKELSVSLSLPLSLSLSLSLSLLSLSLSLFLSLSLSSRRTLSVAREAQAAVARGELRERALGRLDAGLGAIVRLEAILEVARVRRKLRVLKKRRNMLCYNKYLCSRCESYENRRPGAREGV